MLPKTVPQESDLHVVEPTHGVFVETVERHLVLLRKRSRSKINGADRAEFALAAEHMPPVGQANLWYRDVIFTAPQTGREVAKQLARLCGEDSQVRMSWRSLADAVGKADKAGRTRAYVERGVDSLVEAEWLRVVTVGRGRAAKTTFYLLPGVPGVCQPWRRSGGGDDDALNYMGAVA